MKRFQIVWALALIVCIGWSTLRYFQQAEKLKAFPWGADPFGYLVVAQEFRHGSPKLRLESAQFDLFREFAKRDLGEKKNWDRIIGPHASTYQPETGAVTIQYPPGTALTLSRFDERDPVLGLNRFTLAAIFVLAAAGIALAATRGNPAAAGICALAALLADDIIRRMGDSSFSINALIVPLTASIAAAFVDESAIWGSLLSGIFFGYSILTRLAAIFIGPAFVALWAFWTGAKKQSLLVFSAAAFSVGVLPILWMQQRLAGAFYHSLYSVQDRTAPNLHAVAANLNYYLGAGTGAVYNWVLFAAAAGALSIPRFWKSRAFAASWIAFAVPTFYFLTHDVVLHYYSIPGVLAAAVFLAAGSLSVKQMRERVSRTRTFLGLLPGLVALVWCSGNTWIWHRPFMISDPPVLAGEPFQVPAELLDQKAWVWADMLSGTLWYCARKPSFKVFAGDPQTRAKIYRFVEERGEPQFLIGDSGSNDKLMRELVALGAKLEPRGHVGIFPYYRIAWTK